MASDVYRIVVQPTIEQGAVQKELDKASKGAGKSGTTLGNSFATQFRSAIGRRLSYAILDATRDMVQNVVELNKAQTELKKVSDLSGKSLEKFTEQAYQAGEKTAKTGTQIIQASTEFKKMGFTESDSLRLSEISTRFQNIADTEIDAATAAKFINSQMKAFNMTASDSEHIIDAVY